MARYAYRAVDEFGQAIATTKIRPIEVVTDRAPTYPNELDELLQRPGIAPSDMPTTASMLTTDG